MIILAFECLKNWIQLDLYSVYIYSEMLNLSILQKYLLNSVSIIQGWFVIIRSGTRFVDPITIIDNVKQTKPIQETTMQKSNINRNWHLPKKQIIRRLIVQNIIMQRLSQSDLQLQLYCLPPTPSIYFASCYNKRPTSDVSEQILFRSGWSLIKQFLSIIE